MTQPRKEQLSILRAYWTVYTYTATGGVTSTALPGGFQGSSVTQTSGGNTTTSPPTRGIITTNGGGFVRLRKASNALTLDDSGLQIFGRLTFSVGTYTISYKKIVSGFETTATIPAGSYSVEMIFSEVMKFGEVPVDADIIYGSTQELLPSGNSIAGDLVVNGNTTLGTNGSNTISLNARFNTDLIPTPDNIRSLGSSAFRFANLHATALSARADNTDSVKSILSANTLTTTGTSFTIDGNNTINIGPTTATGVNIGRNAITTTINGTLSATGAEQVGGNLTVNGASSVFNGNVNVTGSLTAGTLIFSDLNVTNNTTLGDSSLDNINFIGRMVSDIKPQMPDLYDLGSFSLRWRHLHASEIFANADSTSSVYSYLKPDTLFSTTDFDIDGYGSLLFGVSYASHVHLGNTNVNTTIDGYAIKNTVVSQFRISDTQDRFTVDTVAEEIQLGFPLLFNSNVLNPIIGQIKSIGVPGQNLVIQAQQGFDTFPNILDAVNTGGTLLLKGGNSGFGNLDGYSIDGYPGGVILSTGNFIIGDPKNGEGFQDISLGLILISNPISNKGTGLSMLPMSNNQPIFGVVGTTGSYLSLDLNKSTFSLSINNMNFDGYQSLRDPINNTDCFLISQDTLEQSDFQPKDGINFIIQAQSAQPSANHMNFGGDIILRPGRGGGPGGRPGNIILGDIGNGQPRVGGGSNIVCFGIASTAPSGGQPNMAQLFCDPNDGHIKIYKPNGTLLDLG